MPLLSKLRNQKTHSKLEEWTQLIKKIDPFQEILVQSNRAVHDLFLNQEISPSLFWY